MIYDGRRFRLSRSHVVLPLVFWHGDQKSYLAVGRIVKKPSNKSVRIENKYDVIPVEPDGHGATNLLFGKDGREYLCKDGRIYTHVPH